MLAFRFSLARLLAAFVAVAVALAALVNATELWTRTIVTFNLLALFVAVPGLLYSRHARRAFWAGFAIFGWGYLASGLLPNTVRQPLLTVNILHYVYSKVSRIRPPTFDGAVIVWFRSDGTIFIDGQPVTPDELEGELLSYVPPQSATPPPQTRRGGLGGLGGATGLSIGGGGGRAAPIRQGVDFALFHDSGVDASAAVKLMNRLRLHVAGGGRTHPFPSLSHFLRVGNALFVLLFAFTGAVISRTFYAIRESTSSTTH